MGLSTKVKRTAPMGWILPTGAVAGYPFTDFETVPGTMTPGSGGRSFAVLLVALLEEPHQEEHECQHEGDLEQDREERQEQERRELEEYDAGDADRGELQDWLQHIGSG